MDRGAGGLQSRYRKESNMTDRLSTALSCMTLITATTAEAHGEDFFYLFLTAPGLHCSVQALVAEPRFEAQAPAVEACKL